jgi:predicted CxxxxCH...CXXCH cytochrome family protein
VAHLRHAALALSLAASACVADRMRDEASAGVHDASFRAPRGDGSHGAFLRAERWAPMVDASRDDACGRCHDGTPARPEGITIAAPGATSCTGCHTDPGGVLACNTCHGGGDPGAPGAPACGAHAAHIAALAPGAACTTCHPAPGDGVIGGLHGDGHVEIVFDPARVAPEASYDRATGACAVSCHDRGGARPRPRWTEAGPMRCNDCHGAPPAQHPPGPCTTCHREANAAGTALVRGPLHMNGRLDLGAGGARCGACHGDADDPAPATDAHGAHASPSTTTPIACTACHAVPASLHAPGHMNGVVEIAFTDRAVARDARPTWDGTSCAEVACHGARLAAPATRVPGWRDTSGASRACDGCHGAPPAQHTTSMSCERATCHGGEVTRGAGLGISETGKPRHIDGVVDSP